MSKKNARILTWLHLSDLHLKAGDAYEQSLVLKALVKAVAHSSSIGQFHLDLVFATGDIAHSGEPAQYKIASDFFDDLLKAAALTPESLFVIPGNHDVYRRGGSGLVRTLASEEQSVEFFAPEHPKDHSRKFEAFITWHSEYFGNLRLWNGKRTCQTPVSIDVGPYRIGIVQCNTAMFSLDDHDHGQLWLGRRELGRSLDELAEIRSDFNIMLIHHPLEWLHQAERAAVKMNLADKVQLVLRGHLHEYEAMSFLGPNESTMILAAGAAYQTRLYPNTCMVATLDLDSRQLSVYPLRYEDRPQIWTLDTSMFPKSQNFTGTFSLGAIPSLDHNPVEEIDVPIRLPGFHLGAVVPPKYFVSRERQLKDALELLRFHKSFLVVGRKRSGKTSLISKLISILSSRQTPSTERSVICYLNLERDVKATVRTFLEHSLINMVSETARQVFGKTFADLVTKESELSDADDLFRSLRRTYQNVREQSIAPEAEPDVALIPDDFVEYTKDLVAIVKSKGWNGFYVFFDEANHLPQELSVELLLGTADAFAAESLTAVFAASPLMEKAFNALNATIPQRIEVGPFDSLKELKQLILHYYFEDLNELRELPITDAALEMVWSLTSRYPYQMQCVLWYAFNLARDAKVPRVRVSDVENAYNLLVETQPEYFVDE